MTVISKMKTPNTYRRQLREYLQKLQVIQIKFLKLLLNVGRRNSASELQLLSLLKVFDIHNVNLLSYVNDCRSGRCPTLFSCYYHVLEAAQVAKFMGPTWGPPGSCRPQICLTLDIWTLLSGRVKSQSKWSPSCAYGRTDIGQSSCKIKGARLRNNEFNLVNQHLHKNAFGRLSQDALLELHNKFIISSNVSVCIACFAIVTMSYHTYVLYHKTISKYETRRCWTTHIENVMYSTHLRKHQSSASLAFVREIHRWPVNSPHKGPVTRGIFPFDDVIMSQIAAICITHVDSRLGEIIR